MRILLVNDDGIDAAGIQSLADEFYKAHEVIIVAPDSERSGYSHSVTLFKALQYTKAEKIVEAYAVSGTPADCVKLAILHILKGRKVDLVISGINSGPNLGSDVMYSGTVAAASEAVFLGVPALAISMGSWLNFEDKLYKAAAKFLAKNLDMLYSVAKKNKGKVLLNINYPTKKFKGTRFVKSGINSYLDYYEFVTLKDSSVGAELKGEPTPHPSDKKDCDVAAIREGFASITPIKLDRTEYGVLEELRNH